MELLNLIFMNNNIKNYFYIIKYIFIIYKRQYQTIIIKKCNKNILKYRCLFLRYLMPFLESPKFSR